MRTLVALLLASAGATAGTSTSAMEFTIDGKTYLKEYVWDDSSGTSTETLYVKNEAGEWTFSASLYSDAEANWTGRIGNDLYADQWNDAAQDYVVVIGADLWPTWHDFEAALMALHFWDDGGSYGDIIVFDGGIYAYDLAVFAPVSDGSGTVQVPATKARPGQAGLLKALSNAPNAKARVALLTALTNPTPKSVFPALAKSGNKSSRARP